MENWKERFAEYYNDNENGGSSRWLVAPNIVELFISSLLTSQKQHYKERVDEYIREQMKQFVNTAISERKDAFDELAQLNRGLALDIFGEGEGQVVACGVTPGPCAIPVDGVCGH